MIIGFPKPKTGLSLSDYLKANQECPFVKGSGEIFDEFSKLLGIENGGVTPDKKFSLDATRCIGCCGLAPVLTINDEVYGKITAKDVAGILAKKQTSVACVFPS